MKYRYSILLLVDPEFKSKFPPVDWDTIPFFPGSRKQNYLELLSGFGIPFEIMDINRLKPHHLVNQDGIQFSSILFTSTLSNMASGCRAWLEKLSYEHGISLVSDAFLFSGPTFIKPFGLKRCSGRSFGFQHIKNRDGKTLYKTKRHPFTYDRPDLGVRPLLRFLTQSWFSRKITTSDGVVRIASFSNGKPAICSYVHGKATNYLLNFHPCPVLNHGNLIHSLLRNILESNPCCASASLDLSRITCLRLDDPGSCERVHMEGYNPGVVSKSDWKETIRILKKHNAHLNIAYVPQWVDDGDPDRGRLVYNALLIKNRKPGRHYNSWQVVYSKKSAPDSHDYVSEYREIKKGVDRGHITILSHGLTHLTPDIQSWLKSAKIYSRLGWYKEFRQSGGGVQLSNQMLHNRMTRSADLIAHAFSTVCRIIVPSAHEHTRQTPEIARAAGFRIFSSKAMFLLRKDKIIRNRKIMAFYPKDMPWGFSLSNAGYPTIFVFHDYDIYRNGPEWLNAQISVLKEHGVKSFPSMTQLCSLLMAKMTPIGDAEELNITIDFEDSLQSRESKGAIPLKIGGIVSVLKVNDRAYAAAFEKRDNTTFFSIPFSCIRNAKVKLSLKVQQSDGK